MRPIHLNTKIFLDSGDPNETKKALNFLGFLDGQTTNPSLVVERLKKADPNIKLSQQELLNEYKQIVKEISKLIPNGSVSIEVYSDKETSADTMLTQAKEMYSWIPNAHIKFPTTEQGLEAAQRATSTGLRVNMTLVFSQEQGAAVYSATKKGEKGDVFISPFVGRLDDIGLNGMDLVKNIMKMYKDKGNDHVEVLAASIRDIKHFLCTLYFECDIVTAPFKILEMWATENKPIPGIDIDSTVFEDSDTYLHESKAKPIQYKDLSLNKDWHMYDISHHLTDKGLEKFADDWNQLVL